jgi:hypothetical protein
MSEAITVKGKPLAECSDDELSREWEAGMFFDAQEGLTEQQAARMKALEAEIEKRPPPACED